MYVHKIMMCIYFSFIVKLNIINVITALEVSGRGSARGATARSFDTLAKQQITQPEIVRYTMA